VIEPERRADERGFFARTWCQQEFSARGLNPRVVQCGTSFNSRQGTLRGLHFQIAPREEAKLVRCTHGAVYDVAVDLRTDSPTFHEWFAAELTAENGRMMYLPEGCAHGFLTLADDTEVFYQMSQAYHPESSRGVRWDDPALAIRWPRDVQVISERDRRLPLISASRAAAPLAITDSRG
jgi:dTDP-4-dehydrorhamnose 3,5-epimerase